jgi:hypothetical protein
MKWKSKNLIKLGKNLILPFHCYSTQNLFQNPFFYLKIPLQIAGGTVDHLANGLCRTGNFHLLQLFMDQFLLFIGWKCLFRLHFLRYFYPKAVAGALYHSLR